MRVFPWFPGVLLVLAVAFGAGWTLTGRSDGAHASMQAVPVASLEDQNSVDTNSQHHERRLLPIRSTAYVAWRHQASVHAVTRPGPWIVIGSTQQVLINHDRAGVGLRPLSWSSCLYAVALSNARRMAQQGFISHTNGPTADLNCRLGNYASENVGFWTGGVNDTQLNAMFMNSPDHRANIMGPYHYVATAWVTAPNGVAYIAVEFG